MNRKACLLAVFSVPGSAAPVASLAGARHAEKEACAQQPRPRASR